MKKDSFRQQQRFSLRKYSFGLASVILGASLFANDQTAQAEENLGTSPGQEPGVVTQAEGDPSSTVTERTVLASTAAVLHSETVETGHEVASSTLDLTLRVSEEASSASSQAGEAWSNSEQSTASQGAERSDLVASTATATSLASSESADQSRNDRANKLTNASATITLAKADDADDPMPTDDQLTDTTQFGKGKDSDLGGLTPLISSDLKTGNSLTASQLPSELAAFDPKDSSKRVASLWSIRDASGREDAYFVSFVFDLSNQTYEMRIYDAAKQLMSTERVERQSGAKVKFQLAGEDSASLKEQAFVSLGYENNGYEALYNGTDGDTEHGRPADLSGVKRIYTTLINPQVGTDYRQIGGKNQTYQSTGHFLPSGMTMTINYLEEGSKRQLRASNQLVGFIGDAYTTSAASESEFDSDFQNKGYELDTERLPKAESGKVEGTFWGGKGFVYVRDLTRNGHTMRYRSTVINDDGDIVMEGWDKATGKKIPIRGYKTVYVDAGNGAYVVDRVNGKQLTEYEYVSQPIKAAAYPDRSTAQWGAVSFHVTNGFDHLFTNSWKARMDNVTYWYKRPKGDVMVEYYLQGTDTKIAPDQKAADQVAVKEAYDATGSALRPSEISYNGKRYRLVESNGSPVLRSGSAAMTGSVEKLTQAVQYEYSLVESKGSVAVTYLASDGTVLKARELVVTDQPEGTSYTTTALAFPNYKLLGNSSDSAPTSGSVVADKTLEVVYTYERQKGSVEVVYQAEDGTILEGPTTLIQDGDAGSNYTTSAKTFTGYSFKELSSSSAPASGSIVGDSTLRVVYVYSANATPTPSKAKGSVEVVYQTEDGTILEGPTTLAKDQEEGTSYSTSAKTFTGYSFKELSSSSAPASGSIVGDSTLRVVYVYSANATPTPSKAKGSVEVVYQTEDGTILEGPTTLAKDQEEGTSYSTSAKTFAGYSFKELSSSSAPASGSIVGDSTLRVVYVYSANITPTPAKAKGSVEVVYQAEDGTILEGPTTLAKDQEEGTSYSTSAKTFAGYHFKAMAADSAPASSTIVGDKTLKVVYLYEKDQESPSPKGSVKVEYRDEDGNEIKASRLDVLDAPVGSSYNTNEAGENPTIIDKDGVRYRLLKHEGQETGQVSQGTTTVTYIYQALGQVIVEYVDEYGRRLINPRVVAPWQEPGMDYDASYGNPRYIYRNGVKYEVERVIGQEKGKVGKGKTTITYVYRVVDEPEKVDDGIKGGGSSQKTETDQPLRPTSYKQSDPEAPQATNKAKGKAGKDGSTDDQANKEESLLPETGEAPNTLRSLGTIILGFLLIIFGLFGWKKKGE